MTLRILPSGAFPVGLPQQGGTVALEMDSATSPQLGKFKLKVHAQLPQTVSGFAAGSEGDSDAMPAQSCERTWKGRMHARAHRRCGRARLRRFGVQ